MWFFIMVNIGKSRFQSLAVDLHNLQQNTVIIFNSVCSDYISILFLDTVAIYIFPKSNLEMRVILNFITIFVRHLFTFL